MTEDIKPDARADRVTKHDDRDKTTDQAPAATAAKTAVKVQPGPTMQAANKAAPAKGAGPQSMVNQASTFAAGPIDMQSSASRRLFGRVTASTFVAFVLLPLALASIYFAFFAAERYAVEVKFAIRSPGGIATPDLLGLVSGAAASGSTQTDSYMVVDYLESRQFLDDVSPHVDLKAIYATDKADFLTRMPIDATKEEQVEYFPRVVTATYESASQIITVEVQAFTPQDASIMAKAIIDSTSNLVNKVSENARADTVFLAEDELARTEQALKAQRALVASFRETEQSIDPTSSVVAHDTVVSQLQGELARRLTEMSSLREFLDESAPSVRVLQSQIDSIQRQIAEERTQVGGGVPLGDAVPDAQRSDTLNSSVSQYEALMVDLEFRQRAYVSALASVETARVEALRQQRYVAVFVQPSLPQDAKYPKVLLDLCLLGIVAFLIWGVLTMFIHIVREHVT